MKKQNLQVGEIYNMEFFKTSTRIVKIVSVHAYKVEVQYLDKTTLEVIAVPNPTRWDAQTEFVPFSKIIDKAVA